MISLEMAKKLKEAGLKWEPKFGDHYIIPAVFEEGLHGVMDTKQIMSYHKNPKEWEESIRGFVFTPRLDQLLAEISKTGWKWILFGTGGIWLENDSGAMEIIHDGPLEEGCLTELTGEALLWIYEGRATRE